MRSFDVDSVMIRTFCCCFSRVVSLVSLCGFGVELCISVFVHGILKKLYKSFFMALVVGRGSGAGVSYSAGLTITIYGGGLLIWTTRRKE